MKTLIKLISLLLLPIFLFSCRTEDTMEMPSTQNSFFELKVGSVWKYKTYKKNELNNLGFTFSGYETTVKIIGKESVNGLVFYKKSTQTINTNFGTSNPEIISYIRVNNKGHLVEVKNVIDPNNLLENSGFVLHPGYDINYTFTQSITEGDILYKLHPDTSITVEGQVYNTKPYNGIFTPGTNYQYLQSKTVENLYQKNTGKVKSVCYSVDGNLCIEERLISYVSGS